MPWPSIPRGNTVRIFALVREQGAFADPSAEPVCAVTADDGEVFLPDVTRTDVGHYEAHFYPPAPGVYQYVWEASPGAQGPPASASEPSMFLVT